MRSEIAKSEPESTSATDKRCSPDQDQEVTGERDRALMSSPAGRAYEGDHKNHGEPEVDDDDAMIEEINLDELPDSEGPDA